MDRPAAITWVTSAGRGAVAAVAHPVDRADDPDRRHHEAAAVRGSAPRCPAASGSTSSTGAAQPWSRTSASRGCSAAGSVMVR